MHSPTFRRSTPPSVRQGPQPETVDQCFSSPDVGQPNATGSRLSACEPAATIVKRELSVIREELEVLRERRQALEEQRNRLLAATLPPRQPPDTRLRGNATVSHEQPAAGARTTSERSFMQATTASHLRRSGGRDQRSTAHSSHTSRVSSRSRSRAGGLSASSTSALVNYQFIPSETERRKRLEQNPYSEMKSRIREDCEHDSMCRMGTFLLEDNAKVCTFGRERRFRPLPGEKEEYYLGTQKHIKQELNRQGQRRSQSMHARLTLLDETPGPGAYTPLYAKQSRPSVLTSLYY